MIRGKKKTKKEIAAYMKEYNKGYKRRWKDGHNADLRGYVFFSLVGLKYIPLTVKTKPVNEDKIEIEDQICEYFGCNKKLSLVEKLCGKKCINHMANNQGVYINGLI